MNDDDSEAGKRSWMIAPLERRAYSKALVRVEQEPSELDEEWAKGFDAGAFWGMLLTFVIILVVMGIAAFIIGGLLDYEVLIQKPE